ncbi:MULTISPECIES: hypothetical protein [Streptomyces]|uniref:hypothetical protein n=1 Tax=Streptomyces TaxID=1883 RepID=UPI002F92A7FA
MRKRSESEPRRLLALYLGDHLAGATAGLELMRRIARQHRGGPAAARLARLAAEAEEDRDALREVMTALDLPLSSGRAALGWLGEKAGRLKLNGRLLSRSPLSDAVELEAMRLGVEGKADCRRSLQAVADTDPRIDRGRIDARLAGARHQSDVLGMLRTEASDRVFAGLAPRTPVRTARGRR